MNRNDIALQFVPVTPVVSAGFGAEYADLEKSDFDF
jgi:hypothetical protein